MWEQRGNLPRPCLAHEGDDVIGHMASVVIVAITTCGGSPATLMRVGNVSERSCPAVDVSSIKIDS